VIVYEGIPGVDAVARTPQSLLSGMNLFLKNLDITFRRDPTNYRPRINKHRRGGCAACSLLCSHRPL